MDSNGCVDVKHFNVDVVDSLVLNVSSDTFVCPGQEIEVYVNSAVNPVWNTGDTIQASLLQYIRIHYSM